MGVNNPDKGERKHPEVARDAMEDIKDASGRYLNANRDRSLGEADRTGRHYDEELGDAEDEGSTASKDHEAD